nr:MAG TPA: hypothetical protein [Caudoviricetes sp.]
MRFYLPYLIGLEPIFIDFVYSFSKLSYKYGDEMI